MPYNFDQVIDRTGTSSLKYDFARERGMPEGILPLWVADMDFQTPPCVVDALVDKSRHGIFGYSDTDADYFAVLHDWFSRRFGWEIQPDWLVKTPGIVVAIHLAVQALTSPGDRVLIQSPVYYPFSSAVKDTGRTLVESPLVLEDGRYCIDFDDFEAKIMEQQVKLFILCSPHNPVGRVWTKGELERLGDICVKHRVIILSDEIHADFVYPGSQHFVFADVKPVFQDSTITCTSPSKTFNLAGLQLSHIFIANEGIRQKFLAQYEQSGMSQLGIMGMVASKAAYSGGEDWLEALKLYLQGNLDCIRSYLAQHLPHIKLIEPEGTYLAWLDFRALALSDTELNSRMIHGAGLWLDDGPMFGQGGQGFQRLNFACPRQILQQAMAKLQGEFGA